MFRSKPKRLSEEVGRDHFAAARRQMVRDDLARRGIQSSTVLDCMARVPRERFVPADTASFAYDDRALSIACGQTISQPYIVALMTEALDLSPAHHVLEVGTGSGYQTAVLAELAHDVVTIERYEALSQEARQTLQELGHKNIEFIVGDGSQGSPRRAPYDRIIVTAAARHCPPALLEQLADGGLLVAPLGETDEQVLMVICRCGDRYHQRPLTPCRFVPLVAGATVSFEHGDSK